MSSSPCIQCGRDVADTAKFCAFCGGARRDDTPVETPAPAAPTWSSPPAAPAAPPPPPPPAAPTMTIPQATIPEAPAFTPPPPPPVHTPPPAPVHAPAPAARQSSPGGGLNAHFSSSLGPAIALVSTAAALAMGLPTMVYSLSTYPGSGAKTVLSLLLALTIAAAVIGTVYASIRLRTHGDDQTLSRIVMGAGIFASVLASLEFIAAVGR